MNPFVTGAPNVGVAARAGGDNDNTIKESTPAMQGSRGRVLYGTGGMLQQGDRSGNLPTGVPALILRHPFGRAGPCQTATHSPPRFTARAVSFSFLPHETTFTSAGVCRLCSLFVR